MIRLDAAAHGVVQGVGFRVFVVDRARELGLSGWVANERGSVRCVAEGERETLELFLAELRRGPAASVVDHVSEAWMIATGEFTGFGIRSGWHAGD